MVDFNLIQDLGTEDLAAEEMLREALGEAKEEGYMDEVIGEDIARFRSGEILKGRIVGINKDYVVIDVGLKSLAQKTAL